MSSFPEFDNAKLMIAASVRHCRNTVEDLPVGQIVVDERGAIRSIDLPTQRLLGLETLNGVLVFELVADVSNVFPSKFSAATFGDLGVVQFLSINKTEISSRVVCVPGPHPGTFLLSVVFS
ncbi:MAG TPA: hypothetical protein EYN91_24315 [Candidatus Melainabacteria bacterium]|nr:hypothetical protein [Candidatus Melainabacteria bacterium]